MHRAETTVTPFPRERIVRHRVAFQHRHADGRPDFTVLSTVEQSFRVVR